MKFIQSEIRAINAARQPATEARRQYLAEKTKLKQIEKYKPKKNDGALERWKKQIYTQSQIVKIKKKAWDDASKAAKTKIDAIIKQAKKRIANQKK